MRKKNINTIVIATAITTLLSATATFADKTKLNTAQAPKFSQTQSGEIYGFPKNHLVSVINSGILTQAQKNALQAAILTDPKASSARGKLKRDDHGGFKTVLVGLVKAATLTQSQEGAIPVRSQKLGEGGTAIIASTTSQVQEDAN